MNTSINNRVYNWLSDNGIALRMLKDKERNRFYDRALKEVVPGKHCIDVGFGTGLLSLIALKHGAKHIRAYESNLERYQLGQHMITQLGLKNQIYLVHQSFDATCINNTDEVIFHEIIGAVLYSEGLRCTFNNSIPVCPGQYTTEFVVFDVDPKEVDSLKIWQPDTNARNRMQNEFYIEQSQQFNLGIDVNNDYVNIVKGLIEDYFTDQKLTNVHKLLPKTVSDFTDSQQTLFESLEKQPGQIVTSIVVSTQNKSDDYIEVTVSKDLLSNRTLVIMPRCYFGFNSHTMNIQNGHWNPKMRWQESAILTNVTTDLHIRQSLIDGRITYWASTFSL